MRVLHLAEVVAKIVVIVGAETHSAGDGHMRSRPTQIILVAVKETIISTAWCQPNFSQRI